MNGQSNLRGAALPEIVKPTRIGIDRAARYQGRTMICAMVIGFASVHSVRLSHDIFWQFWVARQMLGGASLYTDIWEINPPLWYWSALPLQWFAEKSGIAWQHVLIAVVLATGAACAWLVARLLPMPRSRDTLLLMLLQFWITCIVPFEEIGEREQLALMLSLPYAALIARRSQGLSTSPALAVLVGALGAYAFALKHYFIGIPLALELFFYLKARSAWSPLRPETCTLAAAAAIYAIGVFVFAPGFFAVALPMVRAAYGANELPLAFVLDRPWTIFWYIQLYFLWAYRHMVAIPDGGHVAALTQVLKIVAAGFALAYLIQMKAAYYQSIPATGALTILTAVHLNYLRSAARMPYILGSLLVLVPASTIMTPRYENQDVSRVSADLLAIAPKGEPAFVVWAEPRLAWPAIEQYGLVWPSRASSLWMTQAIAIAELSGKTTPQLAELSRKVVHDISQDLRCNPPALIAFPDAPMTISPGKTFHLKEFLLRDEDLRRFIANNYVSGPVFPDIETYRRRARVAPISSPNCRRIR